MSCVEMFRVPNAKRSYHQQSNCGFALLHSIAFGTSQLLRRCTKPLRGSLTSTARVLVHRESQFGEED